MSDTRVLTQAASGATAANLCSLFRGRKLIKLVGYALPEMPLSVGSKLKLLSELCLCQTSVYCSVCIRVKYMCYKHRTVYVYSAEGYVL